MIFKKNQGGAGAEFVETDSSISFSEILVRP